MWKNYSPGGYQILECLVPWLIGMNPASLRSYGLAPPENGDVIVFSVPIKDIKKIIDDNQFEKNRLLKTFSLLPCKIKMTNLKPSI